MKLKPGMRIKGPKPEKGFDFMYFKKYEGPSSRERGIAIAEKYGIKYQEKDVQYLYFISQVKTDFVKIGISKDPLKRLKTLQSCNPIALEIDSVFTVEGGFANEFERYLHKFLKDYHVRGEWFSIDFITLNHKFHEACRKAPLFFVELTKSYENI